MKISPLVIHAGVVLPRHTALFSDVIAVTTITVVAGGNVTLNCAAAHSVPVNSRIAVSITDADFPNSVVEATLRDDGDVLVEVEYDHDLSTTPDPERFRAWNQTVKLTGFASAHLNGNRQLVDVPTRRTFIVKPGAELVSVSLTGNEKLLERLEQDIVGWHAVRATDATHLVFPAPASVTRSYTVTAPVVVRNIRVYGALDHEVALGHFVRDDTLQAMDKAHLFVCPLPNIRTSRHRASRTDAIGEMTPSMDFRQLMLDGFEILALIPSAGTAAHVRALDLAHGEVLRAVLRTFFGLRLPRSELTASGDYVAILESHAGAVTRNKAIYVHKYVFQAPAYLTNEDAISPWEWADIPEAELIAAQSSGQPLPDDLTTIPSIGTVPLRDLDFTGILHDGMPQPLLGSFEAKP